jgi:hypothetical protein
MHGMTPDAITSLIAVAFFVSSSPCAYGCDGRGPRMQPDTRNDDPASDDWRDVLGPLPELPSPSERWTARRKAAVIEAVRGGWMPIEEACRVYNISVDEFLAWERDIDRNGVPGLRSTRYQIYRDTDIRRG